VKIIGDSHLKGCAARINQYLNSKFELSSLIKPGACVNHLVQTQENELKCLGKNDVIVINGGTNDVDKHSYKGNGILAKMINFTLNYNNTNIIIVNLPHRYDQANSSRSNRLIQAYNSKLKNFAKLYSHVSVMEIGLDRSHYTKHGLHMNNFGKERFAKQVASQIEMLIKPANKAKSVIPLKWKEEVSTRMQTPTINLKDITCTIENDMVETLVTETLAQNNTINTVNDTQPRISTRNKKSTQY
jgi:hypothetical protein